MNEPCKQVETRSEEVQEIMGTVPSWIVRQGTATIFLVLLAILVVASLFRYPDVISVDMTLTSTSPVARVVANVPGRIDSLYVSDRQPVRAGDPLVLIENAASIADVERLLTFLTAYSSDPDSALVHFADIGIMALGDIQPSFTEYVRALQDYQNFLALDYYPKKIAATRRQLACHRNYRAILERQVSAVLASHEIAKRQFRRDSLLYQQGIITADEMERAYVSLLESLNSLEGARASLGNVDTQIGALEERSLDLDLDCEERCMLLRQIYRNARETLLNSLCRWDLSYRLRSPHDGIVSFTGYWNNNQTLTQGDVLFTVVPEAVGELIGVASLPLERSGKVSVGQRVIIRFSSYPDEEFGVVEGRVDALSLVPESGHYHVRIVLPKGMLTSYGHQLPATYETQATAEIVTDDLRFIERLIAPLRKVLAP